MAQPVETIPQLFYRALEFQLPDALAYKMDGKYAPMSHAEVQAQVERLALALKAHGLRYGDRVAIMSENRHEWAITDFACAILGLPLVTVYATLNAVQAAFILKDSGARWVVCSDLEQFAKVRQHCDELSDLEATVVMDGDPPTDRRHPAHRWSDLVDEGRAMEDRRPEVRAWGMERQPGDLLTLIYTSGTTADPKGAMLTHGNLVSNVVGAIEAVPMKPGERCLSFLPLTHVLERMAGQYLTFHIGASIYYAESVNTVAQNLLEVRPTLLVSVPRIFEKILARIYETLATSSLPKRLIFSWAVKAGRGALPDLWAGRKPRGWTGFKYRLAQALVFKKILERTGGQIRLSISGGAPLGAKVMEFFWAVGVPILEGYGLTETSPVITVNRPGEVAPGCVGRPLYKTWKGQPFLKIAEDGEILCQGPNVMDGYWKNEAATRDAIDAEGYFHTGDIGHLDDRGRLYITDRKKELIVTSGGKKIAPQPIENHLKEDKYISQAVLIGDNRNYITALVVPNFDALVRWAGYKKLSFRTHADLVQDPLVMAKLMNRIERINANLSNYERIRKIAILDHEMTLEGGQLTPSLKVKRRVVNEMYGGLIESLYTEHKGDSEAH